MSGTLGSHPGLPPPEGASQTADVCMILEGSYPYVAGGVSSWAHDLIRGYPDLTFHLVSLVADRSTRELRYKLPTNVLSVNHIYLQDFDRGRFSISGQEQLFQKLRDPMRNLLSAGKLEDIEQVVRLIGPLRDKLGRRILLNSEASWHMVVSIYEESMPESSFLEFFWTYRALAGGLFATMLAPIPPSRLFHAISTGYAGAYGARARLETGRPLLLTEHGIYTNERRIEIMMAEWLFEGVDTGLAIEKPKRDLRDLWLDTFASYSHACYEACDLILTLYTGNQEFQRRQGADPAKLRVVPNGVDYAGYSKVERREGHPPTVALIGRVVPIKDVKTFLRACAILRNDVPDLRALILGPQEEDPGYYEECKALIAHLGIEETVVFTGRVKISDWLGEIDAIALTSVSEAQPLVVLEAGAAGVPTVATDVGCCGELLLGRPDEVPRIGPGGAVTPLAAPNETARELRGLLLDPGWRTRCGSNIKERVRRYYDKAEVNRLYREIYETWRLADERPGLCEEAA